MSGPNYSTRWKPVPMAELAFVAVTETKNHKIVPVLNIQTSPELAQPAFPLPVVGHDLVYLIPECIRVIAVMKVTQLVHHNVVDDSGWSHHALPVNIQPTVLATAGPAVVHIFYFYCRNGYTHLRGEVGNPLSKSLHTFRGVIRHERLSGCWYPALFNHATVEAKPALF